MGIFDAIFYRPLFNLLVFFYDVVPWNDVGLAIVLVTITIKIILLPFSLKTLKAQKALQDLQPKMQELQVRYKDNKEKLAQATMELYRKEKVNPFSSCLPLLIQLPFLFAVFRVFRDGFDTSKLDMVYSFIDRPDALNPVSMGFVDLSEPILALAVLAGIAQFLQTRMLTHNKQPKTDGSQDESMAAAMNKNMMYVMPVVTVIIGASLPGGLTLYWFLFTLLTVVQQYVQFKGEVVSGSQKSEQ